MNKKTYSLSEMAARIGGRNTDAAKSVARQIRGWTDSGFLPVEGVIHSGRGRHRRYNEDALLIAAVLHQLARMGLGSGCLALVSRQLQEIATGQASEEYKQLWCDAVEGTRSVVAAFKFTVAHADLGAEPERIWLYEAGKTPPDVIKAPATVLYALTVIFDRLRV